MALTHKRWLSWLECEKKQDYYKAILAQLKIRDKTELIAPDNDLIFRGLDVPDIEQVRVVIVGNMPPQDLQNADGLALSCYDNNYADRVQRYFDFGLKEYTNQIDVSNKQNWVNNGFMLINRSLTRDINTNKDTHLFWHRFTDKVIKKLFNDTTPRAFIFSKDLGFEADLWHYVVQINDLQPYENISIFSEVDDFLFKHYGEPGRWIV